MKTKIYNPYKQGVSKYESIRDLLLQKYNPPMQGGKVIFDYDIKDYALIKKVVTAESLRAKETGKYLINSSLISNNSVCQSDSSLNEIKLDIKKFFSEADYERCGSDAVRQAFIDGFLNDKLDESRVQIKKRCKALTSKLKFNQNVLYISHTFFLKIFLIYLVNNSLFEEPELIKKYVEKEKRIMEFGETFEVPDIAF